MLSIQSNADSIVAAFMLSSREVNKATARGINRATKVGLEAARANIGPTFPGAKPRARNWMQAMTIRKPFATADRLESGVTVGALSYQMRAPWMLLNVFEGGGTQRARDNVPTLGWKVPKKPQGADTRAGLKPKNLGLAYRKDAGGDLILAVGKRKRQADKGTRSGRGRVYGARKTFVIRTKAGIPAIMQRTGKDSVRALWWLVPSQPVPARPWFGRSSETAASAVLDRYVAEEINNQLHWAFERRSFGGRDSLFAGFSR